MEPPNQNQSAEALKGELVQSFHEFEASFRRESPWAWWTALLAPLVVTLLVLVIIGLVSGFAESARLVGAAFMTFFVFGRFVIVAGELTDFGGKEQLFLMLTYMDVMIAVFVTFHMGILFRIPWAGPKVGALVYDAKFILARNPWMKRVAFLGLIVFVMFPTSTTGSIGGSIFGRLLGLSRGLTLLGVGFGSCLGNGVMYFFAEQLAPYKDSTALKVGGVLVIIGIILFIEWRYRAVKRRYVLQEEAANSVNQADADAEG